VWEFIELATLYYRVRRLSIKTRDGETSAVAARMCAQSPRAHAVSRRARGDAHALAIRTPFIHQIRPIRRARKKDVDTNSEKSIIKLP
jgi:hypothetical protein